MKRRILIVDDEPAVRDGHVEVLRVGAGQFRPHGDFLVIFGDVNRRRPAASAAERPVDRTERLAEERVEKPFHLAAQRHQRRRFGGFPLPLLVSPGNQTRRKSLLS